MATQFLECKTTYISTNTTTNIEATSRNVYVHSVVIPKNTTGTVTFQDVAGSPATYLVFPASTIAGSYILDARFGNGLEVVTSAADVVIINWLQ